MLARKPVALAVVAFCVAALPAAAQTLYKCGNTYSQTPCAPDATAARLPSGAAPDQAPGASGYELCVATAKNSVDSAQPDATRVGALGQKKMEVIEYAGKPVAAHRYDLSVDVMTPYGRYAGARQYACWVSEDQRRVLQFGSGIPTRSVARSSTATAASR